MNNNWTVVRGMHYYGASFGEVSMNKTVEVDFAIIGGGIAGLWLLNRLRQQGFSAVLFENKQLGSGQTLKSQGIIHGGMKYALHGKLTAATQEVASTTNSWSDCFQGKGVIDLSDVPILSSHQYLWSTGSLASTIAGFFASMTLKGNVNEVKRDDYPEVFKQAPKFKGHIYSLDEVVVDVPKLVSELARPQQNFIFQIDTFQDHQLQFYANGLLTQLQIQAEPIEPIQIRAQKYIFTAGSGNEALLASLKKQGIVMQRRPLHMVLVKPHFNYQLYAHCLGLGSTPRITITTHKAHDGQWVWYLGGQIAEEGVKRNPQAQVAFAQKELMELFPWLDFSKASFASFFVDRAEAFQPSGKRPDSCSVQMVENVIAAWPTKLALAPKLADEILALIAREKIEPKKSPDLTALNVWPVPQVAKPIWDDLL